MGRFKECPRYQVMHFRVSEDEALAIMEEAHAAGMNLSDYLRRAAMTAAVRDGVNRRLAA